MARYKPITVIEVRIWNMRVGALAADPGSGYFAFEYDPSFAKTGYELSPLLLPTTASGPHVSVNLPERTFHRLPAFIADSLPDRFGNALIDAWMAREGLSTNDFTVLDRLAYIGSRAMGALEFFPSIAAERSASSAIAVKELVEAARKSLSLSTSELAGQTDTVILQLMRIGTSAGGAKAKAIVGFNPLTSELVSGQFDLPAGFEPWLLKMNTSDRPFGCIEYAYYLMAKDCDIDMMESRLLKVGHMEHFMTKRFDRTSDGRKIHMQTLCAMAGMDFNQLGTYDYLQVFDVMSRLELGFDAADQMFVRMLFNVCMANNDDHAKNHSFLLEQGSSWRLAPAYDMMFASNPANKWTAQHAMGVNSVYSSITLADIQQVADRCHIKDADARIERVLHVATNWMQYAEDAGVDEQTANMIGDRIGVCAARLHSPHPLGNTMS